MVNDILDFQIDTHTGAIIKVIAWAAEGVTRSITCTRRGYTMSLLPLQYR